jgi:hypothetical protein
MAIQTMNEEGVWQELLHNKYLSQKTFSQVQVKPFDSPFWKGLMQVKDDFFAQDHFKLGDGSTFRFWEDVWLGDKTLAHQYPSLYYIVQHRNVLVADVLAQVPLNIQFRRVLHGNKWMDWLHLCGRFMYVTLGDQTDSFVWNLTTSGLFTVKSMYGDLMNDHTPFLRKYLWKLKIPLKIKKIMWFLNNKVLLTKDNLARRN